MPVIPIVIAVCPAAVLVTIGACESSGSACLRAIVYHDERTCSEGNNIEPRNRVTGDGGPRVTTAAAESVACDELLAVLRLEW